MILYDLCNLAHIPCSIWKNKHLLFQWTRRLIANRYAGSFLGPFWAIATPLLMLAVYTFVFGIVFETRWEMLGRKLESAKSYAVILFCGLATFQIFSETVNGSCRCIIDNANLVKKVVFPLEILPIAQMLAAAVTGQVWFILVILAAVPCGLPLTPTILLMPLALLPLMALSLGLAWFAAATTAYLRDFPHFTALCLQALFFLTPIFYPESMVPRNLALFLNLNPLTWLCRQFRELLLFGVIPPASDLLLSWLFCGAICQLGFVWFAKVRKGFADVL